MADPPRPKPPVPGGRRRAERAASKPPVPTPTVPAATEDNPFLPPGSVGKISSSKIDAGWDASSSPPKEAAEEAPESFDDPSLLEDAAPSIQTAAAAPVASVPKAAVAKPAVAAPVAPPVAKVEPAKAEPAAEAAKPSVAPSLPPELRKRSPGKVLAFVLLPVAIIAGGAFAYQSQMKPPPPPPPAPTAEPVASVPEPPPPPPPPTYTAEPPPSASVVKSATAANAPAPAVSVEPAARAYLDGTALPPGRKIIVDGRVVGISPRKVQVRCGTHRVQIGDQDPESVDFPCGGGEVTFTE